MADSITSGIRVRSDWGHQTDPPETVNLVDQPALAETAEALRRQMRDVMVPPQPAQR